MRKVRLFEDLVLLLVYIIILGTGLFWCLSCFDKFLLPKFTLFYVVLSFATVLWIFKLMFEERIIVKLDITYLILLFVAINFISAISAKSKQLSIQDITFIICLAILFSILVDILNHDIKIEGIINIISIVCIIASAIGILQFFSIDITGVAKRKLVEANFFSTTFGYRNYLGEYLAILFPLFLVLSLSSTYYLVLTAISFITIILIQSRAVWISIFISFFFLLILFIKYIGWDILKQYIRRMSILFVFLIFISVSLIYISSKMEGPSNIKTRLLQSMKFEGSSLQERLLFWKVAALMFKENPLTGIGVGNFKLQYLTYYEKLPLKTKLEFFEKQHPRQHPKNVHNELLQILAETGIFGIFIFLWIGIYFFVKGISILRDANTSFDYKILTVGIICGFVSLFIVSFFGFPFHIPPTAIIIVVLCSILVNISWSRNYKIFEFKFRSKFLKILLILTLPFLTYHFMSPCIASYHLEKGKKFQDQGRYNDAIKEFDKALYWNSSDGRIFFYRGLAKRFTGLHRESLDDLLQAAKTVDDIVLRFNIARGYTHISDFKNAEREYKNILNLYLFKEYQMLGHYELSTLYNFVGKKEKSTKEMEKFYKIMEMKK